MESVLVIEDSAPLQRTLKRLFEADGLEVHVAADGQLGLDRFRSHLPSVVVLDLTLPRVPGKELCRLFKAHAASVPIVVLSANSEVEDKVLLLELGADDYVTKPFSPKELLARVRRAMRRTEFTPSDSFAAKKTSDREILRLGNLAVDFRSMTAARGTEAIAFTAQEFKLLKFFAASPGRVITREELLNSVWGYEHYPTTRTVDNHILRLRQKIERDPANPEHFITMHGVGYKFLPEPFAEDR
ncbi:MAG TPA: response regulator transcription factor [Candidatus Dormibacteraeota bacterium]|nr:response regulator transcription factor [Candidatus Dormibacteraeota bacterium]